MVVHRLMLIIARIILVKVGLMVLMEALLHQRKKLVLILVKQKKKKCLSLHYKGDNSYLFVTAKIFKFKANNKNFNCTTQFSLRGACNGFGATASREVTRKCE